jgi:hypothetical protein
MRFMMTCEKEIFLFISSTGLATTVSLVTAVPPIWNLKKKYKLTQGGNFSHPISLGSFSSS